MKWLIDWLLALAGKKFAACTGCGVRVAWGTRRIGPDGAVLCEECFIEIETTEGHRETGKVQGEATGEVGAGPRNEAT